jgi:hypothetical protein
MKPFTRFYEFDGSKYTISDVLGWPEIELKEQQLLYRLSVYSLRSVLYRELGKDGIERLKARLHTIKSIMKNPINPAKDHYLATGNRILKQRYKQIKRGQV